MDIFVKILKDYRDARMTVNENLQNLNSNES